MQQVTNPLPRKTRTLPERPLAQQDQIDAALLKMSHRIGRPLSVDRINQWHEDLAPYPVEAIEWVMDSWGREKKTLPSLSELLDLIRSWSSTNATHRYCGNCNSGWLTGFKDRAGNDAVKRCPCMKVAV